MTPKMMELDCNAGVELVVLDIVTVVALVSLVTAVVLVALLAVTVAVVGLLTAVAVVDESSAGKMKLTTTVLVSFLTYALMVTLVIVLLLGDVHFLTSEFWLSLIWKKIPLQDAVPSSQAPWSVPFGEVNT